MRISFSHRPSMRTFFNFLLFICIASFVAGSQAVSANSRRSYRPFSRLQNKKNSGNFNKFLRMTTRRVSWQRVAIGVAVSITLTTIAWIMKLVRPMRNVQSLD